MVRDSHSPTLISINQRRSQMVGYSEGAATVSIDWLDLLTGKPSISLAF